MRGRKNLRELNAVGLAIKGGSEATKGPAIDQSGVDASILRDLERSTGSI